ncbi:uncharacterized protein HKW66_Vig0240390 [Vigna angularis]|uniref:Uncharacterized protein n=1 Tax=Phaseolus angularis TaxID=3914 RepID=A0A8T0JGM0_PHAAN|nr:uncharacterized protein HKW66_Vig0240390 [Vigna angularis]
MWVSQVEAEERGCLVEMPLQLVQLVDWPRKKKNLKIIESTGAAGKSDPNKVKKYFRLEFLDKEQEEGDEDLDYRALENGYVAVTPQFLSPLIESDIQMACSDCVSTVLPDGQ